LLAEEQTHGSGGLSLGGASLWKGAAEMKDDKLQKLAQAIPQLVKQVEVGCRYGTLKLNRNILSDFSEGHVGTFMPLTLFSESIPSSLQVDLISLLLAVKKVLLLIYHY
jgi:hypothetical protein